MKKTIDQETQQKNQIKAKSCFETKKPNHLIKEKMKKRIKIKKWDRKIQEFLDDFRILE